MLMNPAAAGSASQGVAPPGSNPMASALRGGQTQAGMSGTGMVNAGPSLNAYAGQGIQTDLNTGSLGRMPTADDAGRQRIENAMFERMRPEHQQTQEALEGKLSRMGLARGSEAWNREAQRLGDQQARERFNALEMGGQEQQRLFGMQLQGRQQGWNELQGAGQFHNQAQQQGFGQREAGIQGDYGRAMGAGAQNYNQGMETARFDETLRGNRINEARQARRDPMEEYNLMTGGIGTISDPTFAAGPAGKASGAIDYTGAAGKGWETGADVYNANQANNNSYWNAVGLMGGLPQGYGGYGAPMGGGAPQGYNFGGSYNMGALGPEYL
jgi:hypothetical protein